MICEKYVISLKDVRSQQWGSQIAILKVKKKLGAIKNVSLFLSGRKGRV